MTRTHIEKFAVLDFEASSLSADSWPIEVGLSWIENGSVRTWSSLIRPATNWPLPDWSQQSAAIHGIRISELETAPPAHQVACELMRKVKDRILVSDAPEFEDRWLSRLLNTHTSELKATHPIEHFDTVSFALFAEYPLDTVYETLARSTAPHRAGPDSARLAGAWLKANMNQSIRNERE